MKCNKDCICPDCKKFESGKCWRRSKCEKIGYCGSIVAECSLYEPKDKEQAKNEQP